MKFEGGAVYFRQPLMDNYFKASTIMVVLYFIMSI